MFGLVPIVRKTNAAARNDLWNMDRWFDDFFRDSFIQTGSRLGTALRTDVKETEKEYVLEADMPGVSKDEIRLELKDDMLTIGVEKKTEKDDDRNGYIYRERSVGSMCRRFHVENIDVENVKASYDNGVLRIVLPKAAPVDTTKRISIE